MQWHYHHTPLHSTLWGTYCIHFQLQWSLQLTLTILMIIQNIYRITPRTQPYFYSLHPVLTFLSGSFELNFQWPLPIQHSIPTQATNFTLSLSLAALQDDMFHSFFSFLSFSFSFPPLWYWRTLNWISNQFYPNSANNLKHYLKSCTYVTNPKGQQLEYPIPWSQLNIGSSILFTHCLQQHAIANSHWYILDDILNGFLPTPCQWFSFSSALVQLLNLANAPSQVIQAKISLDTTPFAFEVTFTALEMSKWQTLQEFKYNNNPYYKIAR